MRPLIDWLDDNGQHEPANGGRCRNTLSFFPGSPCEVSRDQGYQCSDGFIAVADPEGRHHIQLTPEEEQSGDNEQAEHEGQTRSSRCLQEDGVGRGGWIAPRDSRIGSLGCHGLLGDNDYRIITFGSGPVPVADDAGERRTAQPACGGMASRGWQFYLLNLDNSDFQPRAAPPMTASTALGFSGDLPDTPPLQARLRAGMHRRARQIRKARWP